MSRFRPVVSDRVPSGTHFAELFLAPGPQAIGATGDNSYEALHGRSWLLVWDRDDGYLHLFQEQPGGAWLEVVADLPPVFASPAPVGSRRWSLAFDQSARVILAYEDELGVVRVTRWDAGAGQYVQNVSFSGADPCLAMDASWSFAVPGSDVLLFYLSSDRARVMCRVQRDVYGTEYELHDFGAPVILDRVIALPYKYQVLVSDSTGAPLPEMLISALYPVAVPVGAHLSAEFTEGVYRQVAYPYAAPVSVQLTPEFVGGALMEPVVTYAPSVGVTLTPEFVEGAYFAPIVKYQPSLGVQLSPTFASGELAELGVPYAPTIGVELTPAFIGGAYEPG